jgi:hypothetical protein
LQLLKRIPDLGIIEPLASSCNTALTVGRKREAHSCLPSMAFEGLIKWIKGDEWRNDFDAVFDRHVGPACRGAGVQPEELADIIGDHGMAVLWGCAFEDFEAPISNPHAVQTLSGLAPR